MAAVWSDATGAMQRASTHDTQDAIMDAHTQRATIPNKIKPKLVEMRSRAPNASARAMWALSAGHAGCPQQHELRIALRTHC
jgi:hypothetical protein